VERGGAVHGGAPRDRQDDPSLQMVGIMLLDANRINVFTLKRWSILDVWIVTFVCQWSSHAEPRL